MNKHAVSQLALLGLLAALCVGLWALVLMHSASGELTFAVLDVGQGDALFIESPTGVQVLIDGGPDAAVLRGLGEVMPVADRSIDAVVATHPDQDHIAGLVDVLRRYEVGAFIEPGVAKSTVAYRALRGAVEDEGAALYTARRGMLLELGGGAFLQVLYPDRDVSNLAEADANEGGIVVRLIYGRASALLTADVPKFVEYRLTQLDGAALESNLLKVGHHGSRTSTSNILLQYAKPSLAVISVAKNSRYGHPHQETLDALAHFKIPVLRTDEEGTVIFTSRGETFERAE